MSVKALIWSLLSVCLAWVATVNAEPAADQAECQTEQGQRLLELINRARAEPRVCGGKRFVAAKPLRWNCQLAKAAALQAEDMARNDFMDHKGSDGSNAGKRVRRAGYLWRAVAENVAAGRPSPEQTLRDWLGSAGHCANLMRADYAEVGAATGHNADSRYGIYWALVLGRR